MPSEIVYLENDNSIYNDYLSCTRAKRPYNRWITAKTAQYFYTMIILNILGDLYRD